MKRLTLHTLLIVLILSCLICSGPAWGGGIRIGGSPDSVRVVFDLEHPLIPHIKQRDRTLIVNFPDTIGESLTEQDRFFLQQIKFDGRQATIVSNEKFTYKGFALREPYRYVIDITAKHPETLSCPFTAVDTASDNDTYAITLNVSPETWPRIRANTRSAFLLFAHPVSCTELSRHMETIPFLDLQETINTEEGMVLVFTSTLEEAALEITGRETTREIEIIVRNTSGISPEHRLSLAREAFDRQDLNTCLKLLEPLRPNLDAEGQTLLARAYWRIAYPYGKESLRLNAIDLMGEGVENLPPDSERDQILLVYTDMLLAAGELGQVQKYIRFLKESPNDAIAIPAHIRQIALLNHQQSFEDAFVSNKRMINTFGAAAITRYARTEHLVTLGDTYLGLNAHSKALALYREAVKADPQVYKRHPGLYAAMADAAFELHDYPHARDWYLEAVNLGGTTLKPRHLVRLGDCLAELGQLDQAVAVFAEVEDLAPASDNDVVAKLRRIRILLDQHTTPEGHLDDGPFYEILDLFDSISISEEDLQGPLEALVKIRLARTYARHGDWNEAFEAYRKSWLDTKKDNPIHVYAQQEARASMLDRLRQLDAKKQYEDIVELDRLYADSFLADIDDPACEYIIAHAMYRTDRITQARERLLACAGQESPCREQTIALLYDLDYGRQDLSQALHWNTTYLQSFPQGPDAARMQRARGELLFKTGHMKEAIPYIRQLADREDSLYHRMILADIYLVLNDPVREARALDRILNAGTPSEFRESALYRRAGLFARDGNPEKAAGLYGSLLNEYPDSRHRWWARYRLARIYQIENKDEQAAILLQDIINGSQDQLLLSSAKAAIGELRLARDITEFYQLRDRFSGDAQ